MWGGTSSIPGTVRPLSFYQLTTLHVFMLITQYSRKKKKQFWPLFVALFCDSINLLRHAGCTLPIFAKYFVKNWIGPKKSKWAIFFGDSARLLLRRCAICPSPSLLRRGYGGTWRTHGKLLRPNWGNVEWMESGSTKASSQLPERWNNKRKRPSFSSTLTTIATPLHKRRIKGTQSSWLDIVWNPWESIICYNALQRHSGNTVYLIHALDTSSTFF